MTRIVLDVGHCGSTTSVAKCALSVYSFRPLYIRKVSLNYSFFIFNLFHCFIFYFRNSSYPYMVILCLSLMFIFLSNPSSLIVNFHLFIPLVLLKILSFVFIYSFISFSLVFITDFLLLLLFSFISSTTFMMFSNYNSCCSFKSLSCVKVS